MALASLAPCPAWSTPWRESVAPHSLWFLLQPPAQLAQPRAGGPAPAIGSRPASSPLLGSVFPLEGGGTCPENPCGPTGTSLSCEKGRSAPTATWGPRGQVGGKQPGTQSRRSCDSTYVKCPEEANPETGSRREVTGGGRGVTADRCRVSFWGDGDV